MHHKQALWHQTDHSSRIDEFAPAIRSGYFSGLETTKYEDKDLIITFYTCARVLYSKDLIPADKLQKDRIRAAQAATRNLRPTEAGSDSKISKKTAHRTAPSKTAPISAPLRVKSMTFAGPDEQLDYESPVYLLLTVFFAGVLLAILSISAYEYVPVLVSVLFLKPGPFEVPGGPAEMVIVAILAILVIVTYHLLMEKAHTSLGNGEEPRRGSVAPPVIRPAIRPAATRPGESRTEKRRPRHRAEATRMKAVDQDPEDEEDAEYMRRLRRLME